MLRLNKITGRWKNLASSTFLLLFFLIFALKALPAQATVATTSPCVNKANFILTLKNGSGTALSGFKFELYEQSSDTSGLSVFGTKIGAGTTDALGQGKINFKTDSIKPYALKVWDKKIGLGDFWFFDAARFVCNYDRYVTKEIPALKIVLRGFDGQLKRNYSFSFYAQHFDSDNKPYFDSKDLILSSKTDGAGAATIYVAPYNPYRPAASGFYALSFKDGNSNSNTVYDISPYYSGDKALEYRFSGLSGLVKNAAGVAGANKDVRLYEQLNSAGSKILGKVLYKTKTDAVGAFSFEYPAGTYALTIADGFNKESIFWNTKSSNTVTAVQNFSLNLSKFSLVDTLGGNKLTPLIHIYILKSDDNKSYYRGAEVGSVNLTTNTSGQIVLAAGKYVAVFKGSDSKEYGKAFEATNGRSQNIQVAISSQYLIKDKTFSLSDIANSAPAAVSNNSGSQISTGGSSKISSSLANSLQGRILIQVESKGEAWYINPLDLKKYYLGRPADAFALMRQVGLGVSNANFTAIEKNPAKYKNLAGRILLKVEDSGRAYYFDPLHLKIYYLGRPTDAFNLIRKLGLGVKNSDLDKISAAN
jgi:hypothetical protein